MINAGDGTHEHPTQALLDLYTMREKLGRLEGLRVAIVGDVLHSRVARSLSFGLVKMGAEVTLVGPPTLIPPDAGAWGVQVSYDIESVLPKLDVCYMLRVQRERQRLEFFPSVREYARLFGLSAKRAAMLPEGSLIMHPGPMNRGVEIDSDVADLPQARDRGTGHERDRDPHVAALPLARRRRRGGPRWLTCCSRGARVIDPVDRRGRGHRRPGRRRPDRGRRERLDAAGAETLDGEGLILAPGLVDLHTHLREPGFEHKETIETGTRAAAIGGYTAVSSMANTEPVTDHAAIVAEVREKAAAAGLADVFPVGAITKGLAGESIAEMGEMVEAGVRVFSDDGNCVPTARTLRNALTYAKAFPDDVVIADHCEDASLVEDGHMHEGVHSYSLGLAGQAGRGRGDDRGARHRDGAR